jgi:hypothetical protein
MTNGGTGDPAYALAYLVTAVDKGIVTTHKLFIWNKEAARFDEAGLQIAE